MKYYLGTCSTTEGTISVERLNLEPRTVCRSCLVLLNLVLVNAVILFFYLLVSTGIGILQL
eukprot:SAG11_NODE_195_length_12838_cov_15.711045_8_plen_61_part_00